METITEKAGIYLFAGHSVGTSNARVAHRSGHHSRQSEWNDFRILRSLFCDFETVAEVNMHDSARDSL